MKYYDKKIRFNVRGPWMKGRASFEIAKDVISANAPREHTKINDERIIALNRDYDAGKIDVHYGKKILLEIKKDLEAGIRSQVGEPPLSTDNQEIVQSFIQTKINVKTGNKPGSRYADKAYIIKAVSLLGNNSLRTVEIAIVQNILNSYKTRGGNRHLVRAFRALFDFVGRMAESKLLRRKKFPQYKPPFLTKEQVNILADVPDDWKTRFPLMGDLILITFNVAGRISESLALEKASVQKSGNVVVIVIDKQWVRKGDADANHPRLRETKNKSTRNVVPIDTKQTLDCLERWLKAYPKVDQRERYRYGIDRYIRKMCKEKFGISVESDSSSNEAFFDLDKLPDADADRNYRATHMLRAGHAVHMTALTGNTKFVADQLGDTEKVVIENYVGRVSSAATISEMAEIIKRKS